MATRNFAPRASGEGKIGTSSLPWGEGNFNAINIGGVQVPTIASPGFTGTPTAPTAVGGTNTTQIATTAFVQAALTALSADVSGPGTSVSGNVAIFNGTEGDAISDGGASIAQIRDRSTHTGTQLLSTISDAGTAAALNVPSAGDAASGEVVKGNDTRLSNARNPNSHAASHIQGGSDPVDADQLQIDVAFTTISADTTPAEVSSSTHLGAILKGIDNVLTSGGSYTDENARDAVGAALVAGNTNSINFTQDDAGDSIAADVQRKTVGLTANSQGALGEDTNGLFVELGTTSNRAASGQDARFPTNDEKAALAGSNGIPSGANPYVTSNDTRMTNARTAVAHAATHARGGSDEIDGDTIEIDWNPTNYTPATTPAEVTNVDELTAHLYGIDQALNTLEQAFDDRVSTAWSTSGTEISASNAVLDADVPNYTLATPVTGDWIPFYDVGAGEMRRGNFSYFDGGGGGSGPNYGSNSTVTIQHGEVTITGSHHAIDTQGGASSDDLETITKAGVVDGDVVLIYAANDARTVVIQHNAGNIYCWGGSTITLDENNKAVIAIWSALYSRWIVIGGGGGISGGTTNNFSATTAPASGNDNTQGYEVGSQWYWPSAFRLWICKSSATGIAVWQEIGEEVTRYEVIDPSTAITVATHPAGFVPKKRYLRDILVCTTDPSLSSPGYFSYTININGAAVFSGGAINQSVEAAYVVADLGRSVSTGNFPGRVVPDKGEIDVVISSGAGATGFDMYFLWSPIAP
jgi:hypothetical protein